MQAKSNQASGWLVVNTGVPQSVMMLLYLLAWIALLTVGFLTGARYDYVDYMVQWTRVLAGENPWLVNPGNAYGVGHQILALLFYVHPLAPTLLFICCWFGSFVIVFEAGRRDATVGLRTFLALFATPFFVVLVCIYGVEDALVTF